MNPPRNPSLIKTLALTTAATLTATGLTVLVLRIRRPHSWWWRYANEPGWAESGWSPTLAVPEAVTGI